VHLGEVYLLSTGSHISLLRRSHIANGQERDNSVANNPSRFVRTTKPGIPGVKVEPPTKPRRKPNGVKIGNSQTFGSGK